MRLLRARDDGTFSLVEFSRNPPPYAILSHTWGSNNEEVTLKDIIDQTQTGRRKLGYEKLIFCAQQAANDGIDYIWVDTCCIDKTSSAELSEAINSMFRWYQHSTKCYVYLADVRLSEYKADSRCLQKSRWFTRGWTLQELLAPKCVWFFTADAHFIGDQRTLSISIIEATGISSYALRGYSLHLFLVTERLKWAQCRSTTREEDAAYSLLGIFDVHMPLIYGEGGERAMSRLLYETDVYEARQYGRYWRIMRSIFSPWFMTWFDIRGVFKSPSRLFWRVFANIAIIMYMGDGPRMVDFLDSFSHVTVGDIGVLLIAISDFWTVTETVMRVLERDRVVDVIFRKPLEVALTCYFYFNIVTSLIKAFTPCRC